MTMAFLLTTSASRTSNNRVGTVILLGASAGSWLQTSLVSCMEGENVESQCMEPDNDELVVPDKTDAHVSAEAAANPEDDIAPVDGVAMGLSALKELGVVHPQDIAGLQANELLEMITEAGTDVTLEDAEKILVWTCQELRKLRNGRPLKHVFTMPDPVTPPSNKYRKLAARLLPDASSSTVMPAKDLAVVDPRRKKAAADLLACFGNEDLVHLCGGSHFSEWKAAKILSLGMANRAGSLSAARRVWCKLSEWQSSARGKWWDLKSFTAVHLQQFLQHLAPKGPTVASGALGSLRFLAAAAAHA